MKGTINQNGTFWMLFRLWNRLCGLTRVMFLKANHSVLEIHKKDLDLFVILLSSIPDRAWTGLKAPMSWSTLLDWSFYLSPSIQLWKHDSKRPNWSTLLGYRFAKEHRRWTLTLWAGAMSTSCFRQRIFHALISFLALFKSKSMFCEEHWATISLLSAGVRCSYLKLFLWTHLQ